MRDYTYEIKWSEDDQQWAGTCLEFPCLSHLAYASGAALDGIFRLVDMTIDDMLRRGETLPIPGARPSTPA